MRRPALRYRKVGREYLLAVGAVTLEKIVAAAANLVRVSHDPNVALAMSAGAPAFRRMDTPVARDDLVERRGGPIASGRAHGASLFTASTGPSSTFDSSHSERPVSGTAQWAEPGVDRRGRIANARGRIELQGW